ncbi:sigma-70 family RNA polymerase sigma factor [Sinomicrobium kalidii]|uniref:RNA polymerase sigma factor n=1 Tax=Sinomicrobium kalidii TaxID=2900738 RepID=UPI001E4A9613|nr:sigma-70 family RNA polymerase sigma factor [Sinomicrobium kalidii]UGU17342.1 sigma-70 family RNA polymerase sigma factor [Sinomicrobium kalidii]
MNKLSSQKIDTELVESLKDGDQEAFRKVFYLLRKRLYYFVFSYAKSDYVADEMVQEVFIKIWQKRKTIKPLTFTTFVFTIARNLTYNHMRDTFRRESAREEVWKNASTQYEQIETRMLLAEYKRIVNRIVDELSPQKKTIYIMSREEGRTNTEIADILGITPKTVKNHLWKIMDTIKTRLRPHLENNLLLLLVLFIH